MEYRQRPHVKAKFKERYIRANERDKRRIRELRYKCSLHGLSLADFDKMVEKQDNSCAICHIPFSESNAPHLDHDHFNEKMRGLLCHNCNCALGFFNDGYGVISNALQYLIKHGE